MVQQTKAKHTISKPPHRFHRKRSVMVCQRPSEEELMLRALKLQLVKKRKREWWKKLLRRRAVECAEKAKENIKFFSHPFSKSSDVSETSGSDDGVWIATKEQTVPRRASLS